MVMSPLSNISRSVRKAHFSMVSWYRLTFMERPNRMLFWKGNNPTFNATCQSPQTLNSPHNSPSVTNLDGIIHDESLLRNVCNAAENLNRACN